MAGYYDAIRKYILYVISVTCQKVTSSLLAESLRLDEAGVDALVGPLPLLFTPFAAAVKQDAVAARSHGVSKYRLRPCR